MTRTQVQIPDLLYGRARHYAESHEISLAEVFRNAVELFIDIHSAETVPGAPDQWSPPVCRPTGMVADPFADENWRERIYAERND